MADTTILRFDNVSFEYAHKKPLLETVSFAVRRGAKLTLMGQNGAGKSTLFKLLLGELEPTVGKVVISEKASVAIGRQIVTREQLEMTVEEFFLTAFPGEKWEVRPRIQEVLEIVHLPASEKIYEKKIGAFSGGQQARLLLAQALIQKPDILLLDEPTNNLDYAGLAHLTEFLQNYEKTVLVISHDAEFLNAFTEGVLYLDVFTHKLEQYTGNYYDAVAEISRRIEKEQSENARLEKDIVNRKEQANFFAQKGGKLRNVAKKMRESIENLEENKVDIRREDRTLPEFTIPFPDWSGPLATFKMIPLIREGEILEKPFELVLKKNMHLLISGPNGIGKTTLLKRIAERDPAVAEIPPEAVVGYYAQDFSSLDFEQTGFQTLFDVLKEKNKEVVYRTAARFLLSSELLGNQIGTLSEGQKGLLLFAKLYLLEPHILIMDEPTNHINFRHLPVIAKALDEYQGALIFVSHVTDFIAEIRIDEVLDLETL